MLKKIFLTVSVVTLAFFPWFSLAPQARAAAYVQVTDGYQVNPNQGNATFTTQGRAIGIDTSKLNGKTLFIPAKTLAEVDAFLASPLYTAIKVAADTTPPTITVDNPAGTLSTTNPPGFDITFQSSEDGSYVYAWSTNSMVGKPTQYTSLNANTNVTVTIGSAANTGYYYWIWVKDAAGNESSYNNYLVTTTDTTGPVLSDISDITPGKVSPPASDINFRSDESGRYQIVYSADIRTLPDLDSNAWVRLNSGSNTGVAGDSKINTDFYYIIYAQDNLDNTSDSGILTVGSPASTGDPHITMLGTVVEESDVLVSFSCNIKSGQYYSVYNTKGDFSDSDGLPPDANWAKMVLDGTYSVTIGDTPNTHYYYKIYTYDSDTMEQYDTGILEVDTGE